MTFKLNPELRLIKAPVILEINGKEQEYTDGESLTTLAFDRHYIIKSIGAREGAVVVSLKENDRVIAINWNEEEAVISFM